MASYLRFIKNVENKSNGNKLCEALCTLCGRVIITRLSRVKSGDQLSCGCISKLKPKKDVTGQDVNGVLFVGYISDGNWKVLYSCGHYGVSSKYRVENMKNSACNTCDKHTAHVIKHGKHNTREYHAWLNMKRRCYDPNNNRSKYYSERGITVCNRWLDSFSNFYQDMGDCPDGYSLERVDLKGNYDSDNCIWASDITQANNKSNNILVKNDKGEIWSLMRWCDILGMNYKSCWYLFRLKKLPISKILGEKYEVIK